MDDLRCECTEEKTCVAGVLGAGDDDERGKATAQAVAPAACFFVAVIVVIGSGEKGGARAAYPEKGSSGAWGKGSGGKGGKEEDKR